MKTIHISDSNLDLSFPVWNDTPATLIEKVKEEHAKTILFLININYKTDNISRTDNSGILFLKYLRLNHFNQHCLLYSFLSREQLMMQDPLNSIIFSEGVSFIRMPEDLSKVDFETLSKKQAPEDLSPFFKAEFRLPDERHFFANWWGVLQLWKVHKAVENIAGKTQISEIESRFAGSLREMHSYQGLVARYVKGIHDGDIENTLRCLMNAKTEINTKESRNRRQIQVEIDKLMAEDSVMEIQLDTLEDINNATETNFLTKLIAVFNSLPSSVQQKINQVNEKRASVKEKISTHQEYLELLDSIDKEKEHIYDERRKLNRQIQLKIDTLITDNSFLTEDYALDTIRRELAEKKPAILFVDDQANDGWAAIFQRIIYGGDNDFFTVFQPEKEDSIEKIVHSIEMLIKSKKIDLLILDLRLKGESGSNLNIKEISGIRVLENLTANHLSCPVLITSASNKILSYKETLKQGADAYWIKEGLDDNYSMDASIENYLCLVDLVYTLCYNAEYRFLYDTLIPVIRKIESNHTPFWWETKFWIEGVIKQGKGDSFNKPEKTKPVDKQEIIDALNSGADLLKMFLAEKVQHQYNINFSKYVSSLVIIQFCRALEIIHRVDKNNERFSISEKMRAQLNEQLYNKYSKLLIYRNAATHDFSAGFNTILRFMDSFIPYISSNILELPSEELVKHENSLKEPVLNEFYISAVESKDPLYDSFYLNNPNLILKSNRKNILLSLRFNSHLLPEQLFTGALVKYQLKIIEKNENTYYYAFNAEVLTT